MELRIVQSWGTTLLDERRFTSGGVVVGYGPRPDFVTAADLGLPPLFTLFRKSRRGWVANLAPGMTGELHVGGEDRGVAAVLAAPPPGTAQRGHGEWRRIALTAGDWGIVRLRDHAFLFQLGPRSTTLPRAPWQGPGFLAPSSAYSSVLHGLLVACTYLFATWPPPGDASLGGYMIHVAQATPHAAAPPPEKRALGTNEGTKAERPAATADKEGKAGGEGKRPRATQSSPRPDPNSRAEIVRRLQDVGPLKYRAELARIAGPSREDARLVQAMARVGDAGYGPGRGTGVGSGSGGGTATRGGVGAGGGGRSTAELITRGPIDTGAGRGARGVPTGVRVVESKVPAFKSEAADALGGLTPEQVRVVVESHRSALQWCFEKELQRNAKLAGKVVVFWQIEPGGSVSTSRIKSSTVGDPSVDDCLQRQVVKWAFPAAANGQITKVFYPFVFSSR